MNQLLLSECHELSSDMLTSLISLQPMLSTWKHPAFQDTFAQYYYYPLHIDLEFNSQGLIFMFLGENLRNPHL